MKRGKDVRGLISVHECINSERRHMAYYMVRNKEVLLQYAAGGSVPELRTRIAKDKGKFQMPGSIMRLTQQA